jgi:predicted TIM-barrel fold metal-dependent hydrolase
MSGEGRIVDCDVHCAPTRNDLYPYLPDLWVEHLQSTRYNEPASTSLMYPPWNAATRTVRDELTLERLQREALDGVSYAILQCYYGVESFTHPYLAQALATAVNRWLQEEWLDRDDRLLASAVVTAQYPDLAVEEIERVAQDRRFVQVLLPARAPAGYGSRRYWPILEAAAKHGLAVGIVFGGGTGTPPTPVNWLSSYYEEYATAILNFQSHVISLVMSGIFAEVPELRVTLVEGGWTWLPPLLWRMDQEWKAFQREVPWLQGRPPSWWTRQHFRLTTQPFDAPPNAAQLGQLIEQLGSDELLMLGSDFPHRYRHGNDEVLVALSLEQRERVLWRNAWELYRLDGRVPAAGARP